MSSESDKAMQPKAGTDPAGEHLDIEQAIDELNRRLNDAERYLANIPGKVLTSISLGDRRSVCLTRSDRDWVVVLDPGPGEDYKHWSKCSLEEKGAIASGLFALHETLRKTIDQRRSQIAKANTALDAFEGRIREWGGDI